MALRSSLSRLAFKELAPELPLRRCLILASLLSVCTSLALASAPPSPQQLLRNASPWLAAPPALQDAPGTFAGEGAVQLYHLRYEQVVPSGLSALVVQRVYQIRTPEGAAMFAPDNVWYDSTRGHFQLLRAEVWRRPAAGAAYAVAAQGRDGGDVPGWSPGTEPRQIKLPRLRAGDRISLVYEILPDTTHDWSLLGGHFLGNMFAFRDSFGTEQVRYVLAARDPMAVSASGLPAPERGRTASGLDTWQWQATDQPPFFQSEAGPAITAVSPFVQVSSFTTWTAMAQWYNQVLSRRDALSPSLLARLRAIALPAGVSVPNAAQTPEVVARVWNYLSHHLSYRGDEQGIHAYVPTPVAEVFRQQQGDCKDGALLLASWLRAVGIPAELALVRTPAMGPLALPSPNGRIAATMAAFDHALVYIPSTGQWLDTTAPHLLDTELPSGDQNSLALLVRSDPRQLVRVPQSPAVANLTRTDIRLSPAQPGWLWAEGIIEVRGAQAPEIRQRYADPGGRTAALQTWLRAHFPGAVVASVAVNGIEPAAATVRLQFRARIPRQQLHMAWLRQPYAELLAPQAERRQALELPLRWENDQTWSLALGNHQACAAGLPSPLCQSSPFGYVNASLSCGNGWLTVHAQVGQTANQINPDEYASFRAFWLAADRILDAPVELPDATSVSASLMNH